MEKLKKRYEVFSKLGKSRAKNFIEFELYLEARSKFITESLHYLVLEKDYIILEVTDEDDERGSHMLFSGRK